MLTLNDGRNELWQWDTGRKLKVDADCSQVHFSNKIFGRSLDVDVVDGVASIPDILLQTDKELTAWAFVGTAENGYTKISKVFKVNKRNKPADYVFTPTEQTTLGEILERLDDLEATQDPDAIKNAVDDYLANNPIKVDETDPTVPEWAKQATPPDVKIPDKLPNPNALTFTGAATGTYDGSSAVTINIPVSGGNVEDGFSPIAKVEQTVTGAVISITDKTGTTTATITNGKDGEDGKSAYEYAQDGGYVGTEKEFAVKMAEEIPTKLPNPSALTINGQDYDGSAALEVDTREFVVNVTDNGDGTYTSDYYFADIETAYNSGRTPVAVMNNYRYPLIYAGNKMPQGFRFAAILGNTLTDINIKNIVQVSKTVLATPDDIPDVSAVSTDPFILHTSHQENEDGTIPIMGYVMGETFAGTTSLEECLDAYLHGKKVLLQINTGAFEGLELPCTYCDGVEAYFEMSGGIYGIVAYVTKGVASVEMFEFPYSLPNPYPLTINGQSYDGSSEVNITLETPDIDAEEVNTLIDTRMRSVVFYGAKGDGVTDDSDAFIAALSNKQSVVFVPGGTYKLSKAIVITENSCLELSQNTLLDFTQTSGNCIEMRGSATLRGNHGNINVSGSFTGNVISVDTGLDGVVHGNIPPYGNWTPLWQRQRFIHDVNITRTEGGFRGSLTGGHSGTALYVSANYGTKEDYNGSSTAPITVIWGMSVTGLRIGGAFDYGINIQNMDKTDSGYGNSNDPAWNHDMRIEAVIVGCETGVRVFNCNTAHLDVTIEPAPSINKVNGEYVKYAKNGIILEHSNHIDLSQSLVWDWNTNGTLVDKDAKNAHIALIGVCKGVIVSDFLYHEHSGTDIRKLIYTDTPSNFDSLIILQEPFTRWFKPIDGVPYFFDGTGNRALMLRSDKFTAEQAEFIHDADGYYERIPNYTNVVTDYENGYYINSSGTTSALAGMVTTGFIPLDGKAAHTFRVGGTGIRWKTDLYADTNYCRLAFYDADKNLLDYVMPVGSMLGNDDNPNSSYPHFIEDDTVDSAIVTSSLTAGINHGAAYFRISAVGKGANLIITIDEKVEDKAIWHGEPKRLDESIYAQKTMISSPGGKVFELTVSDVGALSATEITE